MVSENTYGISIVSFYVNYSDTLVRGRLTAFKKENTFSYYQNKYDV